MEANQQRHYVRSILRNLQKAVLQWWCTSVSTDSDTVQDNEDVLTDITNQLVNAAIRNACDVVSEEPVNNLRQLTESRTGRSFLTNLQKAILQWWCTSVSTDSDTVQDNEDVLTDITEQLVNAAIRNAFDVVSEEPVNNLRRLSESRTVRSILRNLRKAVLQWWDISVSTDSDTVQKPMGTTEASAESTSPSNGKNIFSSLHSWSQNVKFFKNKVHPVTASGSHTTADEVEEQRL